MSSINLKPEVKEYMDNKSTQYIDWDELRMGNQQDEYYKYRSGLKESSAYCEGFKDAIAYLTLNGLIISGGYTHE